MPVLVGEVIFLIKKFATNLHILFLFLIFRDLFATNGLVLFFRFIQCIRISLTNYNYLYHQYVLRDIYTF